MVKQRQDTRTTPLRQQEADLTEPVNLFEAPVSGIY